MTTEVLLSPSLNRIDEAIACYEKVIAIKPDDAEAYCNLCQIYEWQSDLDKVENDFTKGNTQNPRR